MIYTITFNPALDYVVSVDDFKLGFTNRTKEEYLLCGGKGINVSQVLHNLGVESTALGFIAGFTGEEIRRRVEQIGCKTDFITLPNGMSRINLKLKSMEGTEINGMGPDIDSDSLIKLMDKMEQMRDGDVIVLAGSIPVSLPSSIYMDILDRIKEKEILSVVDATGNLLLNVLSKHPFLIKPNKHELEEIFQTSIHIRRDAIPYARKLQEMGAENVLVSFGGEGALLVAGDGRIYESDAPKGTLVNAVGAGDSMVAGFLAGWLNAGNYQEAFYMGLAAGSASAFTNSFATKEDIFSIFEAMQKF